MTGSRTAPVILSAGLANTVGGLNGPPKRGNPSAFRCPGGSWVMLPSLPHPRDAGLLWALLPATGDTLRLGRSTGETHGRARAGTCASCLAASCATLHVYGTV